MTLTEKQRERLENAARIVGSVAAELNAETKKCPTCGLKKAVRYPEKLVREQLEAIATRLVRITTYEEDEAAVGT